jgi:hypothetical protein
MVCDNHPEKATRACVRDAGGKCMSTIVCN